MKCVIRETAKHCVVERDEKPSPAKIRKAILRGENVQDGFSSIMGPRPSRDETPFKVCGNDKELLVGIALFDAMPARASFEKTPMRDTAEVYFDLRHDRLGWFRYEFSPEGKVDASDFQPYPEAHSSDYPLLRLKKHETDLEYFPSGSRYAWRCRWIYAWFDITEVFRQSNVCGFNICRYRPDTSHEFSAWNYNSGNGGPDATSFGNLYREAPAQQLSGITANLDGNTLNLSGHAQGMRRVSWDIRTPLDGAVMIKAPVKAGAWTSSIELPDATPGRYRLTPAADDATAIEPSGYTFDILPQKKPNDFRVSMTWDWPDDTMANYYTPERLDAQMKVVKQWGVQRLHWIDYSDAPAFWKMHFWVKNYAKTRRHCGDVLQCAAEQAHRNGLELVADFKIFDLAMNTFYHDSLPRTISELGGKEFVAIQEIVDHQEWTQQTNPAWRKTLTGPVTCLRFYSREPLPEVDAGKIGLRVSQDNKAYKPYRGPLTVRQGKLRRPHERWTPAGSEDAEGAETNWFIELSGLEVKEPFAALQIEGEPLSAVHRAYMVAEALDADGNRAPLTVATIGHRDFRDPGYFFWKEWPGWNNYTDPILQERTWPLNDFGMTFQTPISIPSLLEPSYEGTRNIWLNRISKMLDAGVDGVCLRILDQHNGVMSWLQYAFAPVVVETFQQRFGRAPQTTPEDYEAVRRIRGEYLTQFLRDAKELTSARGKKLMVQLETVEVPVELGTRMQIFIDYKTWIKEQIVDEVLLKNWTSQSPFIHESVLPLAKQQGIPVHIISRCLNHGLDLTAMDTTPPLLTNAYRAGFSGFNFYEMQNLVEMNPEGVPMGQGTAPRAITQACRELRELQECL